jgi:hypothetical protein
VVEPEFVFERVFERVFGQRLAIPSRGTHNRANGIASH